MRFFITWFALATVPLLFLARIEDRYLLANLVPMAGLAQLSFDGIETLVRNRARMPERALPRLGILGAFVLLALSALAQPLMLHDLRSEAQDLHIWKHAHAAIRSCRSCSHRALATRARRKNLLLFVPLISAHRLLDLGALADVALAFVLFGFCASGTYVINDALDLEADRRHPQKRLRPLASGRIALTHAVAVAVALIGGSVALAAIALPPLFAVALLLYIVTTLWYSFLLKRIAMVDVLSLAGLYTLRVLAGSAAAVVIPSFWLLAFAMFLFLSLAMAKRYAELRSRSVGRCSSIRSSSR